MDNTKQRKYKLADGLTDAAIHYGSFLLAFYVRFCLMDGVLNLTQRSYVRPQLLFTVVYAMVIMAIYYLMGRYDYTRWLEQAWDIQLVLTTNLVGTLFYTAFLYFSEFPEYSRLAIALYFAISTLLVISKRMLLVRLVRYRRRRGYHRKHVVLIGSGHLARVYAATAATEEGAGICLDGYVATEVCPELGSYLGDYAHLNEILDRTDPNEVIIALEPAETTQMAHVLTACENSGIRTSIIPYYNDYLPSYPKIEHFGRCKLINIRSIPLDNMGAAFFKRSVDILGSAAALLLLSPLMLVTAMGVKLSSPGPVFFCQDRVGKDKKPFRMYKFRSMPVDVDHNGWSTAADSRRTPFGSFIRKYSIDELPQLWNVLVGDMSLVGPRPELPNYVHKFSEEIPLYLVRQQVRPGMTGLAQINGLRGDTSIEARVQYDIRYIETWSWLLDFKILAKTALGGFINQEMKTGAEAAKK